MRWQTHALMGINSLWLLNALPNIINPNNIAVLAACATFGALLPDLDAAESKIKHLQISGTKPFMLPASALHQALGHRGMLHSVLGIYVIAISALFLAFWWGWQPWIALVLGHTCHLIADACTKSGTPLFYPNPQRCHLLPRAWRFATNSLVEEILSPLLTALVALLLLVNLPF